MTTQELYASWKRDVLEGGHAASRTPAQIDALIRAADTATALAQALERGEPEPRWSASERVAFFAWDPTDATSAELRAKLVAL